MEHFSVYRFGGPYGPKFELFLANYLVSLSYEKTITNITMCTIISVRTK